MKADEMVKVLAPWLSRVRRPGWKPIVEEGDDPAPVSKFGGIPWTDPEATWPTCPSCGEPLALLLQLDLDALPDDLEGRFGSGLLQLFYCIRNECDGDGGWEPFSDEVSRVRIVHPVSPDSTPAPSPGPPQVPAKLICGWTRFDDLPSPEEHEECGLNHEYDLNGVDLVRKACS